MSDTIVHNGGRRRAGAGDTNAARTPAPEASPFDRKQQYQLRRHALLLEASRVFGQRGFAQASLEDVARNLSITKAALYYYFKSKQELLYECYMLSFDIADDALAAAIEAGGTGWDKLQAYARGYIVAGLGQLPQTIHLRDQEALSEDLRERLSQRRRARRDRLREIVAEGIADGSIRADNPKLVVSAWAGAISWVFRGYDPQGDLTPAEMAEQMIAIFANGLAARPKRRKAK